MCPGWSGTRSSLCICVYMYESEHMVDVKRLIRLSAGSRLLSRARIRIVISLRVEHSTSSLNSVSLLIFESREGSYSSQMATQTSRTHSDRPGRSIQSLLNPSEGSSRQDTGSYLPNEQDGKAGPSYAEICRVSPPLDTKHHLDPRSEPRSPSGYTSTLKGKQRESSETIESTMASSFERLDMENTQCSSDQKRSKIEFVYRSFLDEKRDMPCIMRLCEQELSEP